MHTPIRHIDHIIYAVPDLESGSDRIESMLGIRPVPGGRHPGYGTHNALLSLGPDTYFEVMAPDPERQASDRPILFGLETLESPRLLTWVLRAENLEQTLAEAPDIGLGPAVDGHRDNPDGSRVAWTVTDPGAFPMGGVLPFLISWGNTPHPSTALPEAGSLQELRIAHPEPVRVRQALAKLGMAIPVTHAPQAGLTALIRTPGGLVEIG
jgi:hypothetical protein